MVRARSRPRSSDPAWHAQFLAMLPAIKTHAKIAFRHLGPEAREEAIQETVCNACAAFKRLFDLGKADIAYPTVLASYGVRQVKEGRKVGGRLNCRDVMSTYCQARKDVTVERLDRYDKEEDAWQEAIVEDRRAGPAETAAARIDLGQWLRSLRPRMRKIAKVLATSERTSEVARRFRLSPARISQLRRELEDSWQAFQGQLSRPAAGKAGLGRCPA